MLQRFWGWTSSPEMEATMNVGQTVRVRPASQVARDWNIPSDAQGMVTCKYRLLNARQSASNRLDVRFSPKLVVWGAPEEAFEVFEAFEPHKSDFR
jgi:hypothetical protein